MDNKSKKFLENGWIKTKSGNLSKVVCGINYTIARFKNGYSVYSDLCKVKGIPTLDDAKEEVYYIAYGHYFEDDSSIPNSLLNNQMFAELVKAGYRALAKKYHPDKGGDITKMKALNALHDEIKSNIEL